MRASSRGGLPLAPLLHAYAREAPPGPAERPNALVRKLLVGESARSPQALADAYQRLFLDVADRLASDRILGSAAAPAYAQLAIPLPPKVGNLLAPSL